jgi:hypothetical protein
MAGVMKLHEEVEKGNLAKAPIELMEKQQVLTANKCALKLTGMWGICIYDLGMQVLFYLISIINYY